MGLTGQLEDLRQEETETEEGRETEVVVVSEENEKMIHLLTTLEQKSTMQRPSSMLRLQLIEQNTRFGHPVVAFLLGCHTTNVRSLLKFAKTSHGQVMLSPR